MNQTTNTENDLLQEVRQDVRSIKEEMTEIRKAITLLARIDERVAMQHEEISEIWKAIGDLRDRVGESDKRLTKIESALHHLATQHNNEQQRPSPQQTPLTNGLQNIRVVERLIWIIATLTAVIGWIVSNGKIPH